MADPTWLNGPAAARPSGAAWKRAESREAELRELAREAVDIADRVDEAAVGPRVADHAAIRESGHEHGMAGARHGVAGDGNRRADQRGYVGVVVVAHALAPRTVEDRRGRQGRQQPGDGGRHVAMVRRDDGQRCLLEELVFGMTPSLACQVRALIESRVPHATGQLSGR